METTPAFAGLGCTACGESFDPGATGRCPACGGILTPSYDYDAVELPAGPGAEAGDHDRAADGIGRYDDLLPFPAGRIVSLGEGATPLVACPRLADELGVGAVHVKDEGHNPTGTVADRGAALAVTAAAGAGASEVALPTTGAGGQAVAAYAARAGIDSRAFVPSRAAFVAKAMINVHGGDMDVVGGRYGDAVDAYTEATAEADHHGLAPFETPYRHEGAKTLAYEVVAALDGAPDAVVVPVGHGTTLFGTYAGLRDLRELGHVEDVPPIYAAQAAGCAPVVEAWAADRDAPEPVEHPDTICGGLEIPDPAGGSLVLDALGASDGGAVASPDEDVLESAVTVAATEGVEVGTAGGAAASAASTLAADGDLGPDDAVVLVNPAAGGREDDVLRSHLMGQGI